MPSDAELENTASRSPGADLAEPQHAISKTEDNRHKTLSAEPRQGLDDQTVETRSASAVVPTTTADWILVLNHPEYATPYWASQSGRGNRLEEPAEPYWVYDHATNEYEPAVRLPGSAATASATEPVVQDEEYTGYNPKIHGSYDPNASYATYHNRKRAAEEGADASSNLDTAENPYATVGSFNRFTGQFQTTDVTADRHDDSHKSARQMGAFFDVDAAANSHGGRSLKEERRNQKLTKKQIQEHKEKRQAKKTAKRKQWLMS